MDQRLQDIVAPTEVERLVVVPMSAMQITPDVALDSLDVLCRSTAEEREPLKNDTGGLRNGVVQQFRP
jgi:hypothetical protein